jgi:hypothetical protein
VRAARRGEMYVTHQCTHPAGAAVRATIECLPFSVHLIEFTW